MPMPTRPLDCCRTNCEPPIVKPWPVAIVDVPEACEAASSGAVSIVPLKLKLVLFSVKVAPL